MPGRGLWTPQGEVSLREKNVEFLSHSQLVALSFMHEWAHKFQLTIICKRCDSAVTGRNSDGDLQAGKHASVACQCTEWRYDPARPRG